MSPAVGAVKSAVIRRWKLALFKEVQGGRFKVPVPREDPEIELDGNGSYIIGRLEGTTPSCSSK